MTEAELKLLNQLADDIEYGPTRHGERRPFAMKKLREAFEAGAKSVTPEQQKKEE